MVARRQVGPQTWTSWSASAILADPNAVVYDPNSRLVIPIHCKDVSVTSSTCGFRATITGGVNALAATDIYVFPTATGGYYLSDFAAEIQAKLRAAIGGSATVTCSYTGGVFVITAPGATAITIAAPSSGTDLTTKLFGGTTDQDAVATTWTGATPNPAANNDRYLVFVLNGGLAGDSFHQGAWIAWPSKDARRRRMNTRYARANLYRVGTDSTAGPGDSSNTWIGTGTGDASNFATAKYFGCGILFSGAVRKARALDSIGLTNDAGVGSNVIQAVNGAATWFADTAGSKSHSSSRSAAGQNITGDVKGSDVDRVGYIQFAASTDMWNAVGAGRSQNTAGNVEVRVYRESTPCSAIPGGWALTRS